MKGLKTLHLLMICITIIAVSASAAIAGGGLDTHYNWVDVNGKLSNQEAQVAGNTVPYPLSEIQAKGGFLERRNLRERILRFNDPNKIGYVYKVSPLTGKVFGYYTIKGKISSTQSQMTATQQAYYHNINSLIDSIGDDGTFGPEEFGSTGVFFFTTGGVMIEGPGDTFQYQDAPLPISVPSLNPTKAPTSSYGANYTGHGKRK